MVIGLDGATWDVLDRWIKDGTLPNLGKLRGEGSWGTLRSTIPPITAAATTRSAAISAGGVGSRISDP